MNTATHSTSTAATASSSSTSASDARLDANRRNAQHSTGPRTEAGKARSSQNAVRTGWFSRDLRVAEDKIELYLAFEESWTAELQPEGLLELEAFSDFLRNAWQKREVIEARNQARPASSSAFLDDAFARQFDRLLRYERDFERRANQALRELRRLQSERAFKTNPVAPPPARPPLHLPEDLRRELHVMIIETNHWNAKMRALKAGLLDAAPASSATVSQGEFTS